MPSCPLVQVRNRRYAQPPRARIPLGRCPPPPTDEAPRLPRHGILPDADHQRVSRTSLRCVVVFEAATGAFEADVAQRVDNSVATTLESHQRIALAFPSSDQNAYVAVRPYDRQRDGAKHKCEREEPFQRQSPWRTAQPREGGTASRNLGTRPATGRSAGPGAMRRTGRQRNSFPQC